jgi:hypothetical protein
MHLLSLVITCIYLCRELPGDWPALIIVAILLANFLPVAFSFAFKRCALKLLEVCPSPRQDPIAGYLRYLYYLEVLLPHLSFAKLIIYSVIGGPTIPLLVFIVKPIH